MLYFVPIPCGALTNLTRNVPFLGGEDVTMCMQLVQVEI